MRRAVAAKPRSADARAEVLARLSDWAEAGETRGGLRWLDVAFARFIATHRPSADAATLVAAAWVARAEGIGHSCVRIAALRDEIVDALARLDPGLAGRAAFERSLPSQPAAWRRSLVASGAVQQADELLDDGAPLILDGDRLYLRRYWRHERAVAAHVLARVSARAVDDEASIGRWRRALDALSNDDAVDDAQGCDWQKVACAVAMRRGLTIVTGGPGTGKTFVAARILALAFATASDLSTLRVALAAPTGKAAARLRESIDRAFETLAPRMSDAARDAAGRIGAATTLHALLGSRVGSSVGRRRMRDASRPLDLDLLIVDEASMIDLERMAALLAALPPHAHLVLLGDKDQLASVEAGAVLGDLCRGAERGRYVEATRRSIEAIAGESLPSRCVEDAGPPLAQQVVMLRESRRFDAAIAHLAAAVNAGDAAGAATSLRDTASTSVRWSSTSTPAAIVERALALDRPSHRTFVDRVAMGPAALTPDAHRAWVADVLRAFDGFRLLSALREGAWGVAGLNEAIEARATALGLLAAGRAWYAGRPVLVTRNDDRLGVFNGDVGIALPAGPDDATLRVHFAGGASTRSIAVARLADVETAFAMTVHKSQGSEFDHVLLVLPPDAGRVATRELVYTGITRARRSFELATADEASLTAAIERRTVRASGLADRLGV